MEPPRKTSEDPVLRRSVGNTLKMKKTKIIGDKTEFLLLFGVGVVVQTSVPINWTPCIPGSNNNHLTNDDFDDWGEAKLGSSK